jgi:phosphoserine phosphatase
MPFDLSQLPLAAAWRPRPSVPAEDAPPLPTRCVSVIIPALNEARRIAEVVRHALRDPATAEVIVVDDSSTDDTVRLAADAGARVITSSMLGKGTSMRDGLLVAQQEWVVYLDGDLSGLRASVVSDLARPLARDRADFVKARFGRTGGRVTELTAKPMLKVFFPEVAHLAQPLGGLIAARKSLLLQLEFEDGYGVDIGLLLDALRAGGRVAEVDIGELAHESQPLHDLAVMANEVSRVIYARSRAAGRFHVEQLSAMAEAQRLAAASLDAVLMRRRDRRRLLLLDMDGTLTEQRFVSELARATGHEAALAALLDRGDDAATRSQAIASLFRFVHRRHFEAVAQSLTLRPGAVAWVNLLRRQGFMVGVVSDSYFVAADVLRRRVFADFALAHTLHFQGEVCSGELRLNPAFEASDGSEADKGWVVRRFRQARDAQGGPAFDEIWAVGDHLNDLPMLAAADAAFVVSPKATALRQLQGAVVVDGFEALLQRHEVEFSRPDAAWLLAASL